MASEFTHLDDNGHVRMVDISSKDISVRKAVASGSISMNETTFSKIVSQEAKKGNVLETARIAGIMAAKKTAELIPMCHQINLTHVGVDFIADAASHSILIVAEATISDRTGVEMEALTAVTISALTIYDMCKSYDRSMVISDISLKEKSGGRSGHYINPQKK